MSVVQDGKHLEKLFADIAVGGKVIVARKETGSFTLIVTDAVDTLLFEVPLDVFVGLGQQFELIGTTPAEFFAKYLRATTDDRPVARPDLDCRYCANCGSDPDGLYCGAKPVRALSGGFGWNLNVARRDDPCGPSAKLYQRADDEILRGRGLIE